MAYTERVSISGTALSFLLYECANAVNSQEGFLVGDVTSEITNHISDSQSDNARLDIQIVIRTVLPLPSVSLFYLPTGRIKEDFLSQLLKGTANEIVGWYKFRKNSHIKPTFRDKLISKGLQKYFDKNHRKKTFVTCNLTNKVSSAGSTHTFMYRFGKMNSLDMYEYIEDSTANLGEKVTGYKKANKISPNCIFNKIIQETRLENNTSNAILHIQEAVDTRLIIEARTIASNECTIKELEAEIRQMNAILSDKLAVDLQSTNDRIIEEKLQKREIEMAKAYVEALKAPSVIDLLSTPNIQIQSNHASDRIDNSTQCMANERHKRSPSPILPVSNSIVKPVLNYAAALKNCETPSSSKTNNFSEDLITFDVEDKNPNPNHYIENDDIKCLGDSSPEY